MTLWRAPIPNSLSYSARFERLEAVGVAKLGRTGSRPRVENQPPASVCSILR